MAHKSDEEIIKSTHNTARFFVENRQIAWVLLIGTIASGLLGMNIIDEAARPAHVRVLIFFIFLIFTVVLTVITVAQSKRLADILDVLSDARMSWGSKWRAMRTAWKSLP